MTNADVIRSTPDRAAATWDDRWRAVGLLAVRFGLAYLFFTQLFWKLPPNFGCPPDFRFTTANAQGQLVRTSGLCDWIGIEIVWANRPRQLLVTEIGSFKLAVPIEPLAQMNGAILTNVVQPLFPFSGWLIWGAEAFIVLSLALGLLSRLGGLVAIGVSAQLVVGLANISNPYEWEWGYNQMVLLGLACATLAPGRVFGLDAWLRPKLAAAAESGSKLAQLARIFT